MTGLEAVRVALFCFAMVFVVLFCLYLMLKLFSVLFSGIGRAKKEKQNAQ